MKVFYTFFLKKITLKECKKIQHPSPVLFFGIQSVTQCPSEQQDVFLLANGQQGRRQSVLISLNTFMQVNPGKRKEQ